MPTDVPASHQTKTVVAPSMRVLGMLLVAIGWIGHWIMDGWWPGPLRLWTATFIGGICIGWGVSGMRRLVLVKGGRAPLRLRDAVWIVMILVLGSAILALFYNW